MDVRTVRSGVQWLRKRIWWSAQQPARRYLKYFGVSQSEPRVAKAISHRRARGAAVLCGVQAELPGAALKALEQFAVAMATTQGNPKSSEYVVGETVAPAFFVDDHIQQDINRGPYQTSAEYVAAHMAFLHHDIQERKSSEKASKREDGEMAQTLYDKLQLIMPKLFSDKNKGPTFLCHQDLSANNILVDENGDVAGIIDWEAVITAPRWQACKLPQLLNGSDDDNVPEPLDEEQLEDEIAVERCNDSMHDYEQT